MLGVDFGEGGMLSRVIAVERKGGLVEGVFLGICLEFREDVKGVKVIERFDMSAKIVIETEASTELGHLLQALHEG